MNEAISMQSSDKMIPSGDIQIATQSFGEASDPPVLLIMGATASMLWWPDALCQTLARCGCRVVRYDNRDTGGSTTREPGAGDYSVDDMVGDMWAVLDGHDLPSAHLVGMSLGAMIAQIATLQKPDQVRSLTLISAEPVGGIDEDVPAISEEFMAHFSTMGELDWSNQEAASDFLVEIARLSSGSGQPFDEAAARARVEGELARTTSMLSSFNHSTLQGGDDYVGRLGEIRTPTLVLHGSDDPIINIANGHSLARQIPGARLEILQGVGHELPPSRLPQITTAILDFLAEHRG